MTHMRKFIFIAVLPIFIFLFTACESVKKTSFLPIGFTIDIRSPNIALGTISLQTGKTLGSGINKIEANVFYYIREDVVCVRYKHQFYNYNLFWKKENREAFITALEAYKKDYEERNLNKNSPVKKRKYGVTPSHVGWQSLAVFFQYYADADVYLGYYFSNRSPYFTATQKSGEYLDRGSNVNNVNSPEVTLLFTRAQADELAMLFDAGLLESLEKLAEPEPADVDDYYNDNSYDRY